LYDTFAVAGNKRLEVVVERSGRGLTQIDFIVDVPYAYRHQEGQPGRMPAREVIPDPMPPSFIAALRRVVSGALVGAVLPEE
jgi:hypothetical protein